MISENYEPLLQKLQHVIVYTALEVALLYHQMFYPDGLRDSFVKNKISTWFIHWKYRIE